MSPPLIVIPHEITIHVFCRLNLKFKSLFNVEQQQLVSNCRFKDM